MHRLFQVTAALAALALSACAVDRPASPPASAAYTCPELEPSQPNCRVRR